jgi:hypothetical protein
MVKIWWERLKSLSIPFIGIFVMHHLRVENEYVYYRLTFNSLYWDFCYASICGVDSVVDNHYNFQFPLLGFLLCIRDIEKAGG